MNRSLFSERFDIKIKEDMIDIEYVLRYWFGVLESDHFYPAAQARKWFRKREETDHEIRDLFGGFLMKAKAAALDRWADSAQGRLALILILDQFSRNIHRNTSEAFAGDNKAQALCLEGLELKHDEQLLPLERVFFYFPLEHAESMVLQDKSVSLFGALRDQASPALAKQMAGFFDYACRHREVIRRFGRFPHRNSQLNRPNTSQENVFLSQPGSSF